MHCTILVILCLPALAANLATHDLRVITCNGGEATPYYLRQADIGGFKVGLADFTWSVSSVNVSVSCNCVYLVVRATTTSERESKYDATRLKVVQAFVTTVHCDCH